MKVSLIIPCYNAIDKIGRCLASVRAIDMLHTDYEVIFVDDCSTDGTFELLQRECGREENWRVDRLPANSGSPSRPRNRGVTLAEGDYVFFLDCDDQILPDTLRLHYDHAQATNADVVRGNLLADDGRTRKVMNRLPSWNNAMTRQQRIATIIAGQSITITSLSRTSLLRNNNILCPEEIRMGEDTVFAASILAAAENIEYLDHHTYVYNKIPSAVASITQNFGARELKDHLFMWPKLQQLLGANGINYYEGRFYVNLRYVLSLLVMYNKGDIDEVTFHEFSSFISSIWHVVSKFDYTVRYKEILESLNASDYLTFKRLCRPRLVVAGYDLKFIKSAAPELETHFDVRFDEWPGHAVHEHDEKKSRALLDWAELIWCEWLLGNAVWYAANKRPHQRLIVRMHRFELSRDFGEQLQINQVDAVTAVSMHFFERLLERYPNIPRGKARLLPNYVRVADYTKDFHDEQLFTLGMVGILPARKGLDRALDLLVQLRRRDPRYRLEIFGRNPEELSWIAHDRVEMDYFNRCRAFIAENGLEDAVAFNGHRDVKTALAQKKVGFVLSTSNAVTELPGFESFHLAVADGFASGGISLVLHWTGAEYIWPEEFILPDLESMVDRILSFQDDEEAYRAASERGQRFIEARYGVKQFADGMKSLFQEAA